MDEKKNGEGRRKIWRKIMEEKENGEGKGEKIFFVWRRRNTKRENIGRGIIFCAEEK